MFLGCRLLRDIIKTMKYMKQSSLHNILTSKIIFISKWQLLEYSLFNLEPLERKIKYYSRIHYRVN